MVRRFVWTVICAGGLLALGARTRRGSRSPARLIRPVHLKQRYLPAASVDSHAVRARRRHHGSVRHLKTCQVARDLSISAFDNARMPSWELNLEPLASTSQNKLRTAERCQSRAQWRALQIHLPTLQELLDASSLFFFFFGCSLPFCASRVSASRGSHASRNAQGARDFLLFFFWSMIMPTAPACCDRAPLSWLRLCFDTTTSDSESESKTSKRGEEKKGKEKAGEENIAGMNEGQANVPRGYSFLSSFFFLNTRTPLRFRDCGRFPTNNLPQYNLHHISKDNLTTCVLESNKHSCSHRHSLQGSLLQAHLAGQ